MSPSPIASGRRIHTVVAQSPGAPVSDGDGGFTQTWADLTPRLWQVAIEPATAAKLERVTAGTVLTTASHVVTGPYRSDLTTTTHLLFGARILNVVGVSNPEEQNRETIAVCVEVVP